MKTIIPGLLGLLALAAASMPASAADCTVKGWVEGGQGTRPIWDCSNQN